MLMTESSGEPRIELHGWDSRDNAWHGPDEVVYSLNGCRHVIRQMLELPGSWYGRIVEQGLDGPSLRFAACVHDLGDAGLGVIDLEGSPGGPLHFVLVIPAQRRGNLRPEFAFEFVSFFQFLQGQNRASNELALHDYLERTLANSDPSATLVFSIESRELPDFHLSIAQVAEKLTRSMIAWLAAKDVEPAPA